MQPSNIYLNKMAGNPRASLYEEYRKNSYSLITKMYTTQDLNEYSTQEGIKMAT